MSNYDFQHFISEFLADELSHDDLITFAHELLGEREKLQVENEDLKRDLLIKTNILGVLGYSINQEELESIKSNIQAIMSTQYANKLEDKQ